MQISNVQASGDHAHEYVVGAVKVSPPVAVSGSVIMGMELQDWVLVATLIYTVLQIAITVHRFFKDKDRGSE